MFLWHSNLPHANCRIFFWHALTFWLSIHLTISTWHFHLLDSSWHSVRMAILVIFSDSLSDILALLHMFLAFFLALKTGNLNIRVWDSVESFVHLLWSMYGADNDILPAIFHPGIFTSAILFDICLKNSIPTFAEVAFYDSIWNILMGLSRNVSHMLPGPFFWHFRISLIPKHNLSGSLLP